jgi:hypothetical protein
MYIIIIFNYITMIDEENISIPIQSYHECLIDKNKYYEEDKELQKALQESLKIEELRIENEKKIKYYTHIFNPIFIHLNFIDYYYSNHENDFFTECLKNALQDFILLKKKYIYLFHQHYIDLEKVLNELYTQRINANKKPKINIELFTLFKKSLKKL